MPNRPNIERLHRMGRIKAIIRHYGEIEEEQLIGIICNNVGMSIRTSQYYLRELISSGFISIDDGKIKLNEEIMKDIKKVEELTKELPLPSSDNNED